jgi:hypothetical protein
LCLLSTKVAFVLAFHQKYTTEPQTLPCRICFLAYRNNKLRG